MLIRIDLPLDTDEHKSAVGSDSHLRLMLQLVSFERTFDDMGKYKCLASRYTGSLADAVIAETETWTIPAKILPSNLLTSIGALRQYVVDPPSLNADPKTLIQKKRKRKPRLDRPRTGSDDEDLDGEGGGEIAPGRQRKKKVVEVQNYKSAAFIDDSDDEDEEADKAFFEKEKQLRERMIRMAEQQAGQILEQLKSRKGGRGKGKGKEKEKEKEVEGSRVVLDEDGGLRLVTPDSSDVEVGMGGDEDDDSEVSSDSDDESDGEDDRRRKRRRSSQILHSEDLADEPTITRGPISKETIDSDSD